MLRCALCPGLTDASKLFLHHSRKTTVDCIEAYEQNYLQVCITCIRHDMSIVPYAI